MTTIDEQKLQGVLNGDTTTINWIYDQFFPPVKSLVLKSGGSIMEAEDVFQDALIILYEKVSNDDLKLTKDIGAFFYGLCKNVWGNMIQKKRRRQTVPITHSNYGGEEDIERGIVEEEENKVFWAAFENLGEQCRQLLKLFFENRKMEEIMETLGLASISYTRKKKFQCKEKLVNLVKKDLRYQELRKL